MAKLILGTVQFGLNYGINNSNGRPSFEVAKSILDLAYENHIDELDTADAYGDAQKVLNSYFQNSNNKFKIMSKFIWDKTKDFNFHLDQSLNALNQTFLDGYYFHRFDDFKNFPHFDQVETAKQAGKLKDLGVSLYTLDELEMALNHPHVNLIQLPFNLFDRSEKKQSLLKKAKEKNIKIYIRSVFLQGLFFKDLEALPNFLLPLKNNLIALKALTLKNNLSMEKMAMGYVNSMDFIDGVLIGVDSVEQLKNNLESAKITLTKDLIKEIELIEIENIELLNPANWK